MDCSSVILLKSYSELSRGGRCLYSELSECHTALASDVARLLQTVVDAKTKIKTLESSVRFEKAISYLMSHPEGQISVQFNDFPL